MKVKETKGVKDRVRRDKDGRFRPLSLFKHNYAWRQIMILL